MTRFAATALLLSLTSCMASLPETGTAPQTWPAAALASQCEGRDGWEDPAPPARIYGNTYAIGTCGITALLITSKAGHVVIDTGPAEAAAGVAANIAKLGFNPRDVRWIVTSHEHHDHVGGMALLQKATGARVAGRAPVAAVLASGKTDPSDPQAAIHPAMQPVAVERVLADGEALELGSLRLTAHATPAHAPGSTSWTWQSCEASRCLNMAYVDSVTSVSADVYRFSEHPGYVAAFRASLNRIAALDCDVLLTPHPSASAMFERFAGTEPLVDPAACKRIAKDGTERLDGRLAKEQAAPAK